MINKIGILCTYSFPEGMAPTIRILSYGQGLVENGCKVEVVVFQPKVGDNAYSLSGCVGGVKYAYAHKRDMNKSKLYKLFVDRPKSLLNAIKKIRNSHKEEKFDCILLSFDHPTYLLFFAPVLRIMGIKVGFIGDEFPEPIRRLKSVIPFSYKFAYKFVYQFILFRVLMTEALQRFYDELVCEKPTYILCSILNIARFDGIVKQKVSRKYMCYMGNMMLAKDNVDNIIRAFKRVCDDFSDVDLYLYGTPNDKDKSIIEGVIAELGLGNRVFIKGRIDYNLVPQTLANAERYITEELKNLENMILGAEDKLYALEYELFSNVRDKVGQEVIRIQRTAKAIAGLDVFASLALVAERNHYVRPKVNEGGIIDIKGGRHPVVEQMIDNDMFIANDTYLDNTKKRISIITGPNMAGKSTYMRQTALIVLMAQIGSFVPADKAVIGIVDRIFTRVGASDDLASGQSTFMVEMTEVANILRNATAKSLLILDEIGRGTSTFDGLAIAWAVIEHISNTKLCGAKTLFATHYHELTELEGKLSGVTNYCIAVKEKGDDIVFLRKIVKGGADKSYGIQVAKLAGVPDSVINRAKELVEELSDADITAAVKDLASPKKKPKVEMDMAQMSLFDTVEELKGIDIGNLTPMEALNTLYNLQNKIKNRW